ncbi:MAG TPA: rhomboid family intramembrane serine protease [Thermoanaerobaculia bacterium]|nr:rhomboid family intramembrane serine protease [Thermoanaerobaculia bacterium]
MILVPIGRDEAEVRRHPVVSYTIIALNAVIFVATLAASMASRSTLAEADTKLKGTMTYLAEHPWLGVPHDLDGYLSARDLKQLEQLRAEAAPPPTAYFLAEQQRHLNELAGEVTGLVREASPAIRYGYVPASPSGITLITSMFLHAGLMHLIGNMLFFFVSGPFVEDVFGRPLFAALYLTGGMVATWTHAFHNHGSMVPLVGASGAIGAIMGAYLIRFYRSKVEFLFVPFLLRPQMNYRFFLPAFVVLPLWFVWQFYDAMHAGISDGVAVWAHVGGFIYGAAVAVVVHLTRFEKRFVDPAVESQTSWKQSAELVRAADARQTGDSATAWREIRSLLATEPNHVDGLRVACDLAIENEEWLSLGTYAERLLDQYIRRGETDLAVELIGECISTSKVRLSEKFYGKAAACHERMGNRGEAIDLYSDMIKASPDTAETVRALMKVARMESQSGRVSQARLTLNRAAEHPACPAEWRETIAAQIQQLGQGGRVKQVT